MDTLLEQEATQPLVSMPKTFWEKVIAQHKTEKRRDVHAVVEQYHVQCLACDSYNWRTWRPGEPEYDCMIWKQARFLGLLPVGG